MEKDIETILAALECDPDIYSEEERQEQRDALNRLIRLAEIGKMFDNIKPGPMQADPNAMCGCGKPYVHHPKDIIDSHLTVLCNQIRVQIRRG